MKKMTVLKKCAFRREKVLSQNKPGTAFQKLAMFTPITCKNKSSVLLESKNLL